MHAAAMSFDIHVPASRSLKTKRQAIRPITDGLRQRFRVSVAEVDYHDQWQRAIIAVAAVSGTSGHLDDVLERCRRFVDSAPDVELVGVDVAYLERS